MTSTPGLEPRPLVGNECSHHCLRHHLLSKHFVDKGAGPYRDKANVSLGTEMQSLELSKGLISQIKEIQKLLGANPLIRNSNHTVSVTLLSNSLIYITKNSPLNLIFIAENIHFSKHKLHFKSDHLKRRMVNSRLSLKLYKQN